MTVLPNSTHSQRDHFCSSSEKERGGGGGFPPWNLLKVTSVLFGTIPPLRLEFTLPLFHGRGQKTFPRNNVPRNVPVHHRLHRSSSSSETQLKITSVSHRIPNFSYTEFHPLDSIHHSLGNLGSRDFGGELLLHANRYFLRYFLLLPGIF